MCYHCGPGQRPSRWGIWTARALLPPAGIVRRLRLDGRAEYTRGDRGEERAAMLLYDKGDAPEGAAFLLTAQHGRGRQFSCKPGTAFVKIVRQVL